MHTNLGDRPVLEVSTPEYTQHKGTGLSWTPCVKFRKYFQMQQLSENTFQSFNMEVYERIFFSWNFSLLSGQGKLLILQHIW